MLLFRLAGSRNCRHHWYCFGLNSRTFSWTSWERSKHREEALVAGKVPLLYNERGRAKDYGQQSKRTVWSGVRNEEISNKVELRK